MLEERLKGKTLEEIGDELNITRERVRQILRDRLKKFPKVREDFYKRVFCEYDFSKDDFLISFGENKKVYSYLVMAYSGNKRNHKPIKYLLEDTSFSVYIRKCAEKAIYKDYIRVGDERIKRSRPDISDYIVKTFCVDEISIDDYIDIYNMFLADYNLEKDENLIINKNSYKNKLAESNIVLWGYGGSFRYYDIRSRDYADLLTTLNLEQYIDVEYSADKFVKEYPDLMKEYDIRNGYEFHNLLRKILPEEKRGDIRFRKMPMIEFGKVNRDKIVREFLFRHAPIRADELAEKYEEEYGVKARTVLANYVDCIKEYLHDGVYRVDFPELTYDKLQYMRSLLTEDYYTIDKLNDIFEREFPGTSEKYINAHTLFQIGFALNIRLQSNILMNYIHVMICLNIPAAQM